MTTAGSGIARVDTPSAERPAFTRLSRHGLDHAYLSGLTQDRAGRLYVGTSHDLWRLDPANGAVRHFGAGEGVVSSEVVAAIETT